MKTLILSLLFINSVYSNKCFNVDSFPECLKTKWPVWIKNTSFNFTCEIDNNKFAIVEIDPQSKFPAPLSTFEWNDLKFIP